MSRIKNTLGIDIGGTIIKAGFLPGPGGRCLRFKQYPTPKTSQAILALMLDIIIDYCSRYRVQTLGLGCPGPLNPNTGVIIKPPHLPWKNLPLKKMLGRTTLLPVTIDNDANAFTLAEATFGAGKKYRHVVGLTLGTGIGGGIVIDKKIYHGRGNAGELGYTLLNPQGPSSLLGEKGAVQEYIRAGRLIKAGLRRGLKLTNVKSLADNKSRAAAATWREFGHTLGYTIASLTHVLDPDIIIIGGQIAKAWPRFYPSLKKSLKSNCIFPQPPLIKRAQLGDQAGVIGAALLTVR